MSNVATAKKAGDAVVSGHSDDIVMVQGVMQDEFYHDPCFLEFDDGTVLRVEYDKDHDGMWRVELKKKGTATCNIVKCKEGNDDDDYSDVATIGPVSRVVAWENYPPTIGDYVSAFDDTDFGDLTLDQLKAIYAVLNP